MKTAYPTVDFRPLEANLSNQTSVRAAAAELLSWSDIPTIDIVINSAGIMLVPERTLTDEGIELHFATNHIGHFLLTNLIMPKLIKAAEGSPTKGATRIVNVTSGSPTVAAIRWSDMTFEKVNRDLPQNEQPNYAFHGLWGVKDLENLSYIPLEGYHQSKVANVLFGIGATKRLYEKYGILSLAVHPGVIQTELSRSAVPETASAIEQMAATGVFTYKTLGAGAATSLVGALDPKLGEDVGKTVDGKENYGAFLVDCQVSKKARAEAVSSAEAERLWEVSEKLVNETFAW